MNHRTKVILVVLAAIALGLMSFSAGLVVADVPALDFGKPSPIVVGTVEPGDGDEVIADALEQILSTSVDPPPEEDLVRGAIKGMIKVVKKKSDDPYALFYSPNAYDDFQELTSGQFSGIGVWLKERNGRLEIVSVLPDTPALEAGLKRGDVISEVEGIPVKEMSADEAVARIKGKSGTDVTLTIARDGGEKTYAITRAAIELPNLRARLIENDVGYIRLFGFARGAGAQTRKKVSDLISLGARGVILDLRDNGGGLFTEGIEVASVFIEDGDVVIYRQRGGEDVTYEAQGDAFEDVPLVVLVNEGTASASEIVTGALQDHDRAIVVGTRTYGKGSVQEIVPLVDSSALKLTTAAYLTPEGRDINGQGLEPDVEVGGGARAQQQRAVEIVHGIIVSGSGDQG